MAASASGAGAGEIRLGIAPIGWSNDDLLELGGDITLEQCLREARQAGYAGVEKGGKFPMDPRCSARSSKGTASSWSRAGSPASCATAASSARSGGSLGNWRSTRRSEVPVMVYAETTDTVQAAIDTPSPRAHACRTRSSRATATS